MINPNQTPNQNQSQLKEKDPNLTLQKKEKDQKTDKVEEILPIRFS